MTMPVERARALRWGWEFLWELRTAANLTPAQKGKVCEILRWYPSTSEIASWAFGLPGRMYLRVEDHAEAGTELRAGVPIALDRGEITPAQRLKAVSDAAEFMGYDLRVCENLTAVQRSDLAAVMRHFPQQRDIAGMSRLDKQALFKRLVPSTD